MKKKFLIISTILLIIILGAFTFLYLKDKNNKGNNNSLELSKMMKDITRGVDVPVSSGKKVDKKDFTSYTFIPWKEGLEAYISESQINIDAHYLLLLKTNNNSSEIAKELAKKADPRKWICVEAEVSKILYTDKYVFLIMTNKKIYDEIEKNFEKIVGKENVKYLELESKK